MGRRARPRRWGRRWGRRWDSRWGTPGAWVLGACLVAAALPGCGAFVDHGACDRFEDCTEHYATAFGLTPPSTAEYEANGRCWTDPRLAEVCRAQCEDTMAAYAETLEAAGVEVGACAVPDAGG